MAIVILLERGGRIFLQFGISFLHLTEYWSKISKNIIKGLLMKLGKEALIEYGVNLFADPENHEHRGFHLEKTAWTIHQSNIDVRAPLELHKIGPQIPLDPKPGFCKPHRRHRGWAGWDPLNLDGAQFGAWCAITINEIFIDFDFSRTSMGYPWIMQGLPLDGQLNYIT